MKIIWLTGESGSGKTTLAKALQREWPCIILDGNEMRDSVSLGAGFSKEDRAEHNYRVARLAKVISKQLNVVVSVIAPMKNVREVIDEICSPVWIYVKRVLPEREGYFYEESDDYFTVNTDELSVAEETDRVLRFINVWPKKIYSLFIGRFSPLHAGHLALFEKVRTEGRNVCVAIRDTEISENNPYTVYERQEMLQEKAPYARVIVIPDIEEIVHGRRVGWGVREIRLDEKIESISATAIRNGL